jgi:hypothetical protein
MSKWRISALLMPGAIIVCLADPVSQYLEINPNWIGIIGSLVWLSPLIYLGIRLLQTRNKL